MVVALGPDRRFAQSRSLSPSGGLPSRSDRIAVPIGPDHRARRWRSKVGSVAIVGQGSRDSANHASSFMRGGRRTLLAETSFPGQAMCWRLVFQPNGVAKAAPRFDSRSHPTIVLVAVRLATLPSPLRELAWCGCAVGNRGIGIASRRRVPENASARWIRRRPLRVRLSAHAGFTRVPWRQGKMKLRMGFDDVELVLDVAVVAKPVDRCRADSRANRPAAFGRAASTRSSRDPSVRGRRPETSSTRPSARLRRSRARRRHLHPVTALELVDQRRQGHRRDRRACV
jgi:hypothetical protein